MSKLKNRDGKKMPFFVRWLIRTVLENFIPYLKNRIIAIPSLRENVKTWLAIQVEITGAIIGAVLDLNDVGLNMKARLLMVFDAFYGKQYKRKRIEIFGMPINWFTEMIVRAGLTFVEPYLIRKIKEAKIEREDVQAWLIVQVTVAGDVAQEMSKGTDGLKDRLYELFQNYTA